MNILKGIKTIILSVSLMLLSISSVYAGNIDFEHYWDAEKDLDIVDVHITLDAPEGFNERVEIFLDEQECVMSSGHSYKTTVPFVKEKYSVVVLSSTDSLDHYVFQYPETIDLNETTELHITAIENPAHEISDEETSTDHVPSLDEMIEEAGWVYDGIHEFYNTGVEPAEYDFSDGEEYGIINIQCRDYGAFESLTYTLVGNGHMYDIVLDGNNHDFAATVKLPVGDYYESTNFSYEYLGYMDEIVGDKVSLMWRHRDNLASYGNYYHIDKDEPVEINDLMVYMTYNGEGREFSTNILVAPTVYNEQIEMQEEAYLKKLQEAFPGDYDVPEIESEIVNTAETTVIEGEADNTRIVVIIIVCITAVIGIIVCVVYFRKKRNNH